MLVEMSHITRTFPGVVANDDVDFTLKEGEVHALLGENGAGKTTLMKILTGFLQPDSGEITVRGETRRFSRPAHAIEAGIGMVHQHFKLVKQFTAAENIIMGQPSCPINLSETKLHEMVTSIADQYDFDIEPSAPVRQLSMGEQQRVEILKALFRGADALILDEPISVLTPQESRDLFRSLEEMTDQGHGIIFITHKLAEVFKISDRVTILRDGSVVKTLPVDEASESQLAQLMVGDSISDDLRDHLEHTSDQTVDREPSGAVHFSIEDIQAKTDYGTRALNNFSTTVHNGEIVGVAGVAGNGQEELGEVLGGIRPVQSGRIKVGEKDVTHWNPRDRYKAGLTVIPTDRQGTGLVPGMSMIENGILREYYQSSITPWTFLNYGAARDRTESMIDGFDVRYSSLESPVQFLSGGNQQKLLLARELFSDPEVIVAMYPFQGLDVATVQAVHEHLLESRSNGRAILLVSENLDHIFKLSDRIIVISDGENAGEFPPDPSLRDEIGLAMAGKQSDTQPVESGSP